MHAELKIGDSIFMLGGDWPDHGRKAPAKNHDSGGIHLYAAGADKAFQRVVGAGCEVVMPPSDLFRGDRCAKVKDSSDHHWGQATHVEHLEPDECAGRAAARKAVSRDQHDSSCRDRVAVAWQRLRTTTYNEC